MPISVPSGMQRVILREHFDQAQLPPQQVVHPALGGDTQNRLPEALEG